MRATNRTTGKRVRIPPRYTQTYKMLAPLNTHWRPATCDEVDCPTVQPANCADVDCGPHLNGWKTVVPAGSDLADLARGSGRQFVEVPVDGGLVEFRFPAGQRCFARHQREGAGPCQQKHVVPLERPGIYVVRGAQTVRFSRSELWAEHWAEHADRIRAAAE